MAKKDEVKELRKEVKRLTELLYKACEALDDGSAWADDSEEFDEIARACGYRK